MFNNAMFNNAMFKIEKEKITIKYFSNLKNRKTKPKSILNNEYFKRKKG